MEDIADDFEGVAKCIMCGKPLSGLEKVKYRDWWAHAECAQKALETQVDQFNRIPFILGSFGFVVAFVMNFFILLQFQNLSQDPIFYGIPFLGMAIGLLFQTFGFYGFTVNYDEGIGVLCSILAIAASVIHFLAAGIIFLYGYEPQYYDPVTGDFLLLSLPGMYVAEVAAVLMLLILMAIIGIMILLLGESVTSGFDNRVVATIFIAAAGCMILSPFNFFLEAFLVTALFLTAKIPEEWKKVEFE